MISRCKLLFFYFIVVGGGSSSILGCYSGGGVAGSSLVARAPNVDIPTIVTPSVTTYYSSGSSLEISGMCNTDYTVKLSGVTPQQTPCVNSTYSFTVSASIDGVYNFLITQVDSSAKVSEPVSLVWVRKSTVAKPVVVSPSANPHLSSESELVISGSCETGSVISLAGDGLGTSLCLNSQFSITLPKFVDGDFNINIVQTDLAGNTNFSTLTWKKHELAASPSGPILEVATAQTFSFSGGSGSYTLEVATNNSGGTLDGANFKYTTGTLAGVTDTLKVTDSLGVSKLINVVTTAATPDHLEFGSPSGQAQSAIIGQTFADPLTARVVDRFGNGIAHFPLYFRTTRGDAVVQSSPLQMTDLSGYASVTLKAGTSMIASHVEAAPLGAVLPDVNGTGQGKIIFEESAIFTGKGSLGTFFGVGQAPNGFVTDDFNSDGLLDTVVLNSGDPSLGVLIGQGNGLYALMYKVTPLCSSPNAIAKGDFDLDGKMDLIISCGNSLTTALQVFLGRGDGTFNSALNVPLEASENIPAGLAVADFDNNGKLDVATAIAGSAEVSIRMGNGDGTFNPPTVFAVGGSPIAVVAADFNKDGNVDVAVVNSADGTFSLLPNNGSGAFGAQIPFGTGSTPIAIVAGDFDSDGYPDVAVVNSSDSTISTFLNDKAGSFIDGPQLATGGGANALLAQDLDQDGHIDLVVSNGGDNSINVLWGLGTGNFSADNPIAVTSNPVFVGEADINQDGKSELLVLGGGNRQLQSLPLQSGRVVGYVTPVGVDAKTGIIRDLDGDSLADLGILSSGSKMIEIYKGNGKGLFTPLTTLSTGDSSSNLIVADLRMNHAADLVVTNPALSNVRVFLSNGDGTFAAAADYQVGAGPSAVVAGDFNRDGKTDLAVINATSNILSILFGNGDGTFQTKVDYATGGGPSAIVASDFNSDEITDLAVANKSSATVSVFIGNENGTFQSYVDYDTAGGPSDIVASDLNRDGHIDLAVTASFDGIISVLIGSGTGSFKPVVNYSAGLTPTGLVVSDFNGDSKVDLAVANGSSSAFSVLPGTGNGQFNTLNSYEIGGSAGGIFTGEINSDGSSDIVILDTLNKNAQTWLGH